MDNMNNMQDLRELTLSQIARKISNDWKNVNYAARPYLSAMYQLNSITDTYGYDSGKSIVLYFLSNATSWRGNVARDIKKHLNLLIKG